MRAIYIDDDPTNRAVIKAMLRTSGMLVDEAADMQTGLKMVNDRDYQVVLVDLRMPGMNGVTGIRQLRARLDDKRQLPIIVVSGDLTTNVRELCRQAGASDFLEKPIMMPQLLAKVGVAVGTATDVILN